MHEIVGLIHSCSDASSKVVIIALAESPAVRIMTLTCVYGEVLRYCDPSRRRETGLERTQGLSHLGIHIHQDCLESIYKTMLLVSATFCMHFGSILVGQRQAVRAVTY